MSPENEYILLKKIQVVDRCRRSPRLPAVAYQLYYCRSPLSSDDASNGSRSTTEKTPLSSLDQRKLQWAVATSDPCSTVADCRLCDQEPETCEHLFIYCSFTKQLWINILAVFGKLCPDPRAGVTLQDRIAGRSCASFGQTNTEKVLTHSSHWSLGKFGKREMRASSARCACKQSQLFFKIKAEAENWVAAWAVVLGCLGGE